MKESWLRTTPAGDLVLTLHVQPGARKTEIAGMHGDALKLRLAAPAVEGKANACLVGFLAGELKVGRSQVELLTGATGRRKRVLVRGVSQPSVAALRRSAGDQCPAPASYTKRPSTRV